MSYFLIFTREIYNGSYLFSPFPFIRGENQRKTNVLVSAIPRLDWAILSLHHRIQD